jgi:hypothetical protein
VPGVCPEYCVRNDHVRLHVDSKLRVQADG